MARERHVMLPEIERNSSSNTEMLSADRDNNTILMKINGCRVTVVCRAEANPEVYDRVREILISSIV